MMPIVGGAWLFLAQALAADKAAPFRANRYSVAVVRGKRNYARTKIPVDYTNNGTEAMREWLLKLGFRKSNIIYICDAIKVRMEEVLGSPDEPCGELCDMIVPGCSDVFVYYPGHNAPNPEGSRVWLLSVDVSPDRPRFGYPVELMMRNLEYAARKAGPGRKMFEMLDACFFDQPGGGGLLAASARGFGPSLPKAKAGNVIRISAASRREVASWDRNLKLGLMTSRFLAGAAGLANEPEFGGDSDGCVGWAELAAFVRAEVRKEARMWWDRRQTPEMDDVTLLPPRRQVRAVRQLIARRCDDTAWARAEEEDTRLACERYLTVCDNVCAHRRQAQGHIGRRLCAAARKSAGKRWAEASAADTGPAYCGCLNWCHRQAQRCPDTCRCSAIAEERLLAPAGAANEPRNPSGAPSSTNSCRTARPRTLWMRGAMRPWRSITGGSQVHAPSWTTREGVSAGGPTSSMPSRIPLVILGGWVPAAFPRAPLGIRLRSPLAGKNHERKGAAC